MVDAAANTGTDFLQAINSLQGKPITTSERNQALKGIAKEYTDLSKGEQEVGREAIIQKPPEPGKPPAPPTSDPMKSFGSVAMMFATLGSLMTRRPLTNALNAGAKVMQAQNNQDWAAYKTAYDEWKFHADELMKLADWKNQQIKNIMDAYKGQEDMIKAQFGVLAAASGDPDLDRMKDVMTVQEIRDRNALLTATYKQKMDAVNTVTDLTDVKNEKWMKDNGVTDIKQVPKAIIAKNHTDAISEYHNAITPSGMKMTAAVKSQTDGIDDTIKDIDDAIALARTSGKSGLPLGGSLSGEVNKVAEAAGAARGEFGSPEAGYKAKLGKIKEEAVTALAAGKKLGKDERENIYSMIPTEGAFITSESQIAGLEELKQKLLIKKREITNNPQSYYTDLESLQKAFNNGEISPEKAREIAIENDWIK